MSLKIVLLNNDRFVVDALAFKVRELAAGEDTALLTEWIEQYGVYVMPDISDEDALSSLEGAVLPQ